ncbi:MAG: hypothetical protein P1R58_04635 [bacterium]|nr:hypothetical protein [bacterium]
MYRVIIAVIIILVTGSPVRSAKFASDPFSLGVSGRGLAMGGAVVAGPFDMAAPYWNPAGMNYLHHRSLTAMHAETFGSLLNHDFIAYVDSRERENSMVTAFGSYLYYLGGGGIKITALDVNNRPYVVREESHGDYLLGFSISGRKWDKADFGATAKIIYRDIGTESGIGLTVDAGMLLPLREDLMMGVMISDVTTGFIRYSGKTFSSGANTESIYPTVKPGLTYTRTLRQFTGRLAVSGDIKFEDLQEAAQYSAGALSLDTHFGTEISFKEMLFGRAGFDIGRFTTGAGIDLRNIVLDFAYLHHSELDETFRVSAGYRW